ncbi:MAG: YncE family protein [Limisphaerales bacterium]
MTPLSLHRAIVPMLLLCVIATNRVIADGAQSAPIQTGHGHLFACTDYTAGNVFIVSAEGKVQWEYKTGGHCNELWVLPNGNLLFNTGHAIKEITPAKEVVFDYESKSEIYAAQRLANGNTFIGECNAGRLIEVTPALKIVKEIRLLPEGKDGGHPYMRNARKLADGHYLVCLYADQIVKELDADGKLVHDIPANGSPHSAIRLPNGNTLIATGDYHGTPKVFEVDKNDKVVWSVKDGDLPGIKFYFMAGLQRLPNGNTVFTDWLGHGHFGAAPHLIEVTPDKKVVWTFADHKTMRTISSVQLLDVPGDAIKGEVLH